MSGQPTETDLANFRERLRELGEEGIRDHLAQHTWGDGPRSWKWIQATEYLAARQENRVEMHRTDAFRVAREANALSQDAYRLAEAATKGVADVDRTSARALGAARTARAASILAVIVAALALARSFGWL